MIVCCDLDGVIWRGDDADPGLGRRRRRSCAPRACASCSSRTTRASGSRTTSRSLQGVGVDAAPDDVVHRARRRPPRSLAHDLPAGASVLACAGPGVVEALEARGLRRRRSGAGRRRRRRLAPRVRLRAADPRRRRVRAGARFVATNLDPTYPIPGGLVPGAGALVAAVATAAGRRPEVAGKPEAADGRARARALRDDRSRRRRPAVDRRRARRRARLAVRTRAVGRRGAGRGGAGAGSGARLRRRRLRAARARAHRRVRATCSAHNRPG